MNKAYRQDGSPTKSTKKAVDRLIANMANEAFSRLDPPTLDEEMYDLAEELEEDGGDILDLDGVQELVVSRIRELAEGQLRSL